MEVGLVGLGWVVVVVVQRYTSWALCNASYLRQHFLAFLPLPHAHGPLRGCALPRPTFSALLSRPRSTSFVYTLAYNKGLSQYATAQRRPTTASYLDHLADVLLVSLVVTRLLFIEQVGLTVGGWEAIGQAHNNLLLEVALEQAHDPLVGFVVEVWLLGTHF
jgi:hypothetical protein